MSTHYSILLHNIVLTRPAVSLSALTIANARGVTLLKVSPNSFPATRIAALREVGDDRPVEYIQVRY